MIGGPSPIPVDWAVVGAGSSGFFGVVGERRRRKLSGVGGG